MFIVRRDCRRSGTACGYGWAGVILSGTWEPGGQRWAADWPPVHSALTFLCRLHSRWRECSPWGWSGCWPTPYWVPCGNRARGHGSMRDYRCTGCRTRSRARRPGDWPPDWVSGARSGTPSAIGRRCSRAERRPAHCCCRSCLAAVLGHAVLALVVLSVLLRWLVVRLSAGDDRNTMSVSRPGPAVLQAVGRFGIPWLIGCLACGRLAWPAAALGICLTVASVGMLQRPLRFRLLGAGQAGGGMFAGRIAAASGRRGGRYRIVGSVGAEFIGCRSQPRAAAARRAAFRAWRAPGGSGGSGRLTAGLTGDTPGRRGCCRSVSPLRGNGDQMPAPAAIIRRPPAHQTDHSVSFPHELGPGGRCRSWKQHPQPRLTRAAS